MLVPGDLFIVHVVVMVIKHYTRTMPEWVRWRESEQGMTMFSSIVILDLLRQIVLKRRWLELTFG